MTEPVAPRVAMRPARSDDLPVPERWFVAGETDMGQVLAANSPDVVLSEDAGAPVAMAGVKARLRDMAQIGGVFAPDAKRDRSYARRALAGLLRQCKAQGVSQSVRLATDAASARPYAALRYRSRGHDRIGLPGTPRTIGDPT